MTSNEILEILKKGLDNKELKSLYANQIVKKTDAQGFIRAEGLIPRRLRRNEGY